jgi:hypothetical protein
MHPEVISNKPGKCPARKRNRLTNINVCPVLRGKDTFHYAKSDCIDHLIPDLMFTHKDDLCHISY